MLGQQILNGLSLGCVYALVALGYSMVYGMLRLLNFAHGDVLMVGAFAGWGVLAAIGGSVGAAGQLGLAALAAALVAGLIGAGVERFAYRPVLPLGRLAPLVSALGASIVLRSAAALLTGGRSKVVSTAGLLGTDSLAVGGLWLSPVGLLVIATTGALLVGLDWLCRKTPYGRRMRAVSHDPGAAELAGVDVRRVVGQTFWLGSVLAGVAGLLVAMYYTQVDFQMGFSLGLKAFVAAVLGGIGQMWGAVLGGLALGVAESLGVAVFGSVYKDLTAFVVLILVLSLRPQGIVDVGGGRRA